MIRLTRGFFGIWSQLRRLNRNLEWLMLTHPYAMGVGLPPSKKDIKAAAKDTLESVPYTDDMEEQAGADAIIRAMKARRAGKKPDPDDPASDFDIYA